MEPPESPYCYNHNFLFRLWLSDCYVKRFPLMSCIITRCHHTAQAHCNTNIRHSPEAPAH